MNSRPEPVCSPHSSMLACKVFDEKYIMHIKLGRIYKNEAPIYIERRMERWP